MKSAILSILFISALHCCAQVEFTPSQAGWGSGILFNPVGHLPSPIPDALEVNEQFTVNMGHWRNYLSGELSSSMILLRHQFRRIHYAAQFHRSGYAVSHKISGNVHLSAKLADHWSIGVGTGLIREMLGEQEARMRPGIGISSYFQLTDIRIATYLQYAGEFSGVAGVQIPLSARAVGYIENSLYGRINRWHGGLAYALDSAFTVTIGYQSLPARPSMGIAWLSRSVVVSIAAEYHPNLGFHPCASMIIPVNRKGKKP